jgi:hypothetical protein
MLIIDKGLMSVFVARTINDFIYGSLMDKAVFIAACATAAFFAVLAVGYMSMCLFLWVRL